MLANSAYRGYYLAPNIVTLDISLRLAVAASNGPAIVALEQNASPADLRHLFYHLSLYSLNAY
jgi:hypothetical protein